MFLRLSTQTVQLLVRSLVPLRSDTATRKAANMAVTSMFMDWPEIIRPLWRAGSGLRAAGLSWRRQASQRAVVGHDRLKCQSQTAAFPAQKRNGDRFFAIDFDGVIAGFDTKVAQRL